MVCCCPLVPLFWALGLGVTLTPSQCRGGGLLTSHLETDFCSKPAGLASGLLLFQRLDRSLWRNVRLEFAAPTFANGFGSQFAFFGCSLHKNHKIAGGEFPSMNLFGTRFSVIFTLGVCTIYWDHKISLFTLFLFGDTVRFSFVREIPFLLLPFKTILTSLVISWHPQMFFLVLPLLSPIHDYQILSCGWWNLWLTKSHFGWLNSNLCHQKCLSFDIFG